MVLCFLIFAISVSKIPSIVSGMKPLVIAWYHGVLNLFYSDGGVVLVNKADHHHRGLEAGPSSGLDADFRHLPC